MLINKSSMAVLLLLLTINCQLVSADNTGPWIGMVQPGCEEIDNALDDNLKNADQQTHDATQVLLDHVEAKEAACLPVLQDLGRLISLQIPSLQNITLQGLLDKVKRAVCQAANDSIKKHTDNMNVAYNAPYGLGGFKVGVSNTGTQVSTTNKDIDVYSAIEKEAISLGTDVGKKAVDDVSSGIPKADGINRRLKQDTNDKNNTIDSWRKSVDDSIKKM